MLTLNFSNTYAKLLILGILLTPFFGIFEVLALIKGTLISQGTALTPVYIKVLKDIVFATIIMMGILELYVGRRIIFNRPYTLFIVLTACSAFISFFFIDPIIFIAGVRWLLPLLIFPFIYRYVDADLQSRIAKWLIILLIVGLFLQIVQLFITAGIWGSNVFGLGLRNPGFYIIPSSMACFAMLTAYYARHYCNNGFLRKITVFLLVPVSILLTASGTGIISLTLFLSYILYCNVKQKFIIFAIVIAILTSQIALIPILTNRSSIYESMKIRIELLPELASLKNAFVSSNFGSATNTGVLLNPSSSTTVIADSTVNSLIYNTGFVSLLFFGCFLYKSLFRTINRGNVSFALVLFPFFLTTILFELFPANLLLMVNLAYFSNPLNKNLAYKSGPSKSLGPKFVL